MKEFTEVVILLVEAGWEPDTKDANGISAEDWAKNSETKNCLKDFKKAVQKGMDGREAKSSVGCCAPTKDRRRRKEVEFPEELEMGAPEDPMPAPVGKVQHQV